MPLQPDQVDIAKKQWRTVTNLVLHLHPATVPGDAIRFTHTFGLGGMAAVLIALQVLTGVLLRFQYEPSVDKAYLSILALQQGMTFGQIIRNVHYWSGQFLVIITFLHMARVVFTSGYFHKRRMNWLIGLGLFLGVILMNFTGYLLPWNQLSYWAVTVASSMLDYIPLVGKFLKFQLLGGNQVGQATLMNFYNFHTGILPALLIILMAYHFWKVRKAGGVILPSSTGIKKEMVPTIPDLVLKELATGLLLLAFVFLFSLLVDAPLMEKANPSISPNPAKAPWYFLGLQELIVHLHPFFSVFLVPVLFLTGIVLVPFSRKAVTNEGTWFSSPGARNIMIRTALFTILFMPAWIVADEYLLHFDQWFPSTPLWISEGLFPLLLFSSISFVAGWMITRKFELPYNELIINGFIYISLAYIIMMLTSIYFRGPGMELFFPF